MRGMPQVACDIDAEKFYPERHNGHEVLFYRHRERVEGCRRSLFIKIKIKFVLDLFLFYVHRILLNKAT